MSDNITITLTEPEATTLSLSRPDNTVAISVSGRGQKGDTGADGADGADGPAGEGVPTGGTTGQALVKASGDDYDTEWGAAGLDPANNLSDLDSAATARENLGLGPDDSVQFEEATITGNLSVTDNAALRIYSAEDDPGGTYVRGALTMSGDNLTISTEAGGTGTAGKLILGSIVQLGSYLDFTGANRTIYSAGIANLVLGSSFVQFAKDIRPQGATQTSGTSAAPWACSYVGKTNQLTSSATDPTTTQYPSDKDWGVHKNTSSGNVFLAYNDGGTIKKVALT